MKPNAKTHLTLTRRKGEAIRFDGPAIVEIVRLSPSRVVVRCYAPASTQILREELVCVNERGK